MRKLALALAVGLVGCTPSMNQAGPHPDGATGRPVDMATLQPSDGGVTMNGDTVSMRMTSFNVPAGGELFMCQDFANPFGADAEIAEFEAHMSTGSHHMLFLYQPNAQNGALTPCSGLTFAQMAFGAQSPDVTETYPAGVAALVPASQGFRVVSHYLNATTHDLTANVEIIMHKAQPGTVTQHAGVYFLDNISGIHVPPGTEQMVTAQYTVPHDLYLLSGVGHMHQRTKSLVASVDGQKVYESDSWDNSPQQDFAPPILVKKGSIISWTCDINNTTASTLTFGESAQTNEMCIFDGQYYPVVGSEPNLEQQQ